MDEGLPVESAPRRDDAKPLDVAWLRQRAEAGWQSGLFFDAAVYDSVLGLRSGDPALQVEALARLGQVRQARNIQGFLAGGNAGTWVFLYRKGDDEAQRICDLGRALALVMVQVQGLDLDDLSGGEGLHGDESLARWIRARALPGAGVAVVFQPARTLQDSLPLHDLFMLYANPDEPGDFALAKYLGESGVERRSAGILHPESRTRTQFSIVIPTRNGAPYLRHNLRTLLEQDFDDFEIVISDNSPTGREEVRDLVREVDSSRIRYFRTERDLDLPDSFEFAYAQAQGEHLFAIGADDGLLLHGLSMLAEALKEAGPEADVLKYEHMYYGWPDAQPQMFQYFTRIPMRKKRLRISTESSQELLLKYLNHQASYANLPYGYGEAVLSRRLVNQIKKKTGRLFPALAQDLFMGCHVLALTDTFFRLAYPISVWGASANCSSIGTVKGGVAYTRWAHTLEYYAGAPRPIKGFLDGEGRYQSPYYYHPDVCGFMANDLLFPLCAMDMIERKLVPESWREKINWESYFRGCVQYIYEDSPCFGEVMDQVLEKIRLHQMPEVEAWFLEQYYRNPAFQGVPVPPVEPFKYGLFENDILYLKGDAFGLETIYDAALFYRKLTHV